MLRFLSRFAAGPRLPFFIAVAGAMVAVAGISGAAGADEAVDFNRQVRPLLSNHCFKCHGPDEATREAGLRLDTPQGAYENRGGYQPITPHDPGASEVIERIRATTPGLRMPPPESDLELSPAQIDLLERWIEQGAKYDQHWSLRPIRRPAIPQLPATDRPAPPAATEPAAPGDQPQPPTGPLDQFIDRRLHRRGLHRSPEASPATLIRRLYLDLLGLAPAPADVDRFVADRSPAAYEHLVDRLLANPHFGEKWGRHWLDHARYADTHGYTIDSPRTMWPYRDWVIDALNADLPFDQFTIDQLAGDLRPDPTDDQLIATGFHRNTLINQEGGTDAEQFRNEATVDRVNTTGAVWLGLTVGCAQCHTHKFDPLTHREYYQLFAFFNQASDTNSVAPTTVVATAEQRRRIDVLDRRLAEARAELEAFDRERVERHSGGRAATVDPEAPVVWSPVDIESSQSVAGATFEPLGDGSLLVGGENAAEDTYTLAFRSPLTELSGIRLEVLTHPSLPRGGPGRAGNGNFVLSEIELQADQTPARWLHASADHSQQDYHVRSAVDQDLQTGWAINGAKRLNVQRTATFALERMQLESASGQDGVLVTVKLRFGAKPPQYNIGRFRLAVTDASSQQLGVPDPDRAPLLGAVKRAEKKRQEAVKSLPEAMIMRDRDQRRATHLLVRGDFLRKGEKVQADTPAFLPPLDAEAGQASRMDLARWLVRPDHPLTARVTVNRLWMRLFGRGLVETENDFGLQGTPPTHPELLDWLARELIDNDWSIKHMLRTIVCSATYRQRSHWRPQSERHDPLGKWLSRQARLRVDAEIVRDLAESASGLLAREIGGPSVYPPQPDGVYAFTQRRASWPTSRGADRHRRGMYTFFMRSAPHPMLSTFDVPSFNTTCTRRTRSNTPLQALMVANDTAMLEAARGLAERLLREEDAAAAAKDEDRIARAFCYCFSREPTARESERLDAFLDQQRKRFTAEPQLAAALADVELPSGEAPQETAEVVRVVELAATAMMARVLMNLDEFITRE